jgi:small subunit ribosomal protein S20
MRRFTRAARRRARRLGRFTIIPAPGSRGSTPIGPAASDTRTNPMANTRSAKKMTRKIAKRTAVNRTRRSRMRTFIRKVEEAIAAGDAAVAATALKDAEPEMMRAAQKGVVHKNTASRKVSRLAARVKALSA